MGSLAKLLELACQRGGSEVVLETGQPAIVTTTRGGETMGKEIGEDELISLLTSVVSSEQQVELAVGNAIEFALRTSGGTWSLVTEPGMEGILVRARRNETQQSKVAVGQSHHPHLFRQDQLGTPLSVAAPENKLIDPTGDTPAQGLDIDLGLELSFNLVDDEDDNSTPAGSSATEETTIPVTVDDSEDIRFDTIDDDIDENLQVDKTELSSRPIDLSSDSDEFADFGLDLQVEINEEIKNSQSSVHRERSAAEVRVTDSDSDAIPIGIPNYIDDTKDYGPSCANKSTSRSSSHSSVTSVAQGALCIALASDIPVTVIDAMDLAQLWIRHGNMVEDCNQRLKELPPGSCIVIDVEDPSVWLGWLLRRLEEGYRGFVVSKAKSFRGAISILLGIQATQAAVDWLQQTATVGIRWGESGLECEEVNHLSARQ